MSFAPSAVGSSANEVLFKTEQLLSRNIKRQVKWNTPVDTKEIMETAKKIYYDAAKKLSVETTPVFLVSKGWTNKCMARHNVDNVIIKWGC